jgi:hypothetical protein
MLPFSASIYNTSLHFWAIDMEQSVVVPKVILNVGSKFVGANLDSFEAD